MLESAGSVTVRAGVEYLSREYILQSDWFKSFLPRSRAVYITRMQGFYQTLSPRLQWVGSGERDYYSLAGQTSSGTIIGVGRI